MKKFTFLFIAVLSALCVCAQLPTITFFDGEFDGIMGDGEGGFALNGRIQAQSNQTLSLVNNPLSEGINTSEKVLEITPNSEVPARVITMIRVADSQVPEGLDKIDITGYTTFSFKYYAPELTGNTIRVQWDASETNPQPSELMPEAAGSWEEVIFDIPSSKKWIKIQIMLNQTTDNNGYWPENVTNRTIYLDDIKVEDKSGSGLGSVKLNELDAYTYNVNGETRLALQSEKTQDVTVQLQSITGQMVQNLYQGTLSGALDLPISNVTAGLYLIQISDGTTSKGIKLFVK